MCAWCVPAEGDRHIFPLAFFGWGRVRWIGRWCEVGGKMSQSPGLLRMGAEWVPVGAWGGRVVVSTMAGKRLRRWPRVSPLPRDPLCPTQSTPSRGRGRGWGNIELLFPRWDASVFAIDGAAPHPPFGHLPPEGEGSGGSRCGEEAKLFAPSAFGGRRHKP